MAAAMTCDRCRQPGAHATPPPVTRMTGERRYVTVLTVLVFLFLLGAFLLGGARQAGAHTPEAAAEWWQAWHERVTEAGGITPGLLTEAQDFIDRHEPPPFRSVTESTPTPSAGQLAIRPGVEQWRGLVASYGGWNVDRMLCLMGYESNGNPTAVNPTSGAAGLFQVMPFWWDHYGGDRFDPATNVRVAHLIWQEQGYRAWSPYKRGLCR